MNLYKSEISSPASLPKTTGKQPLSRPENFLLEGGVEEEREKAVVGRWGDGEEKKWFAFGLPPLEVFELGYLAGQNLGCHLFGDLPRRLKLGQSLSWGLFPQNSLRKRLTLGVYWVPWFWPMAMYSFVWGYSCRESRSKSVWDVPVIHCPPPKTHGAKRPSTTVET